MIVTTLMLLKASIAQLEAYSDRELIIIDGITNKSPPRMYSIRATKKMINNPKTCTLYRMDYFKETWINNCSDLGITHHNSEVKVILL